MEGQLPFCIDCGARMENEQRFCGQCGAAAGMRTLQPSSADPPRVAAAAPAPGKVLAALPQITKPKFGLAENYTIVFTSDSAIFAKLSNEVIKDVIRKSQAESKAAGKGWMGKVNDQMKAFYNAHLRYLEMSAETILAEDKANFALPHAAVSSLKVKNKFRGGDEDGPGDEYLELEFESSAGKHKFHCASASSEVVELLRRFYGLKMRQ